MLEADTTVRNVKGRRLPLAFFKLAFIHPYRGRSTHHGLHSITCHLVAFQTGFMSRYTYTGVLYMYRMSKISKNPHGQMYYLWWPST